VGAAHLYYNLNYAQTAEFGGSLGDWQMLSPSASVDYANGNNRLPFDLKYTGGYTETLSGPTYETGLFQRLLLSQGIVWRKWRITVTDDVSYRPQSPTTGFSGIPGVGEPIGVASPTPPSNQTILTLRAQVVDNAVHGEVEDNLNFATTLNASGTSEVMRYTSGSGLDLDSKLANAGLKRRLNGRNSLTAKYMFSQFGYPDYKFSFVTNSVLLGFTRKWNRKISTDVSAGPQFTGSSDSADVPSSTGFTVNAMADYHFRFVTASLNYIRGVDSGGGFLIGAKSDSVTANYSQEFGRSLNIGLDGSYRRTTGLVSQGAIYGKFGGVQATRQLGRHFNVFANYTAMDQSSSSLLLPTNLVHELLQVVSFGVGYSPKKVELIAQ
jgi:hypothetical protein